jgi:hypothetical protein
MAVMTLVTEVVERLDQVPRDIESDVTPTGTVGSTAGSLRNVLRAQGKASATSSAQATCLARRTLTVLPKVLGRPSGAIAAGNFKLPIANATRRRPANTSPGFSNAPPYKRGGMRSRGLPAEAGLATDAGNEYNRCLGGGATA